MYKALRNIEKGIDRIVDIIFVLVLTVGLYYVYDAVFVFNRAAGNGLLAYKPSAADASSLKALSRDCIGWITIYDTGIDYPIMQGKDNSEYLNKDPYGAYSLSGSIYLDSRNSRDFSDPYSLIYGHHMSGGYMFGALDDFRDESFFREHRKGEIIIEGDYFPVEVFAFTDTDANEGIIFNPEAEADRLTWIRQNNVIMYGPKGERIVALSTCKSPTSTLRTILFLSIVD